MSPVTAILSENAKQSVKEAFRRAAIAGLVRQQEDSCSVEPLQAPSMEELRDGNLFVITISSFAFRLLALFQVGTDPESQQYYQNGNQITLEESFSEVTNMCCGALSRELASHFTHLAMSTPFRLSGQCLAFLDELRPNHLARYVVTINNSVRVQCVLCMCCSAAVDFTVGAESASLGGGELEIF